MIKIPEDDEPAPSNIPVWAITFADMMTNVLTFFVMLVSFAELDVKQFREALGSMQEAFGATYSVKGQVEAASEDPVELGATEQGDLVDLGSYPRSLIPAIRALVEENALQNQIEVEQTRRGIVLRLHDQILFDPGSDLIKSGAEPILEKLAEVTALYPEGVSIEGHTDDRPIRTARFPSNWELSSARAIAMFNGLRRYRDLSRNRIRIIGYAETQPVASNSDEAGRSRNRRVEFVFERPGEMDHSWPSATPSAENPPLNFDEIIERSHVDGGADASPLELAPATTPDAGPTPDAAPSTPTNPPATVPDAATPPVQTGADAISASPTPRTGALPAIWATAESRLAKKRNDLVRCHRRFLGASALNLDGFAPFCFDQVQDRIRREIRS